MSRSIDRSKMLSPEAQLRRARRELKELKHVLELMDASQKASEFFWADQNQKLKNQLADQSDRTLPAKTALLKELSYLVQATSRAVRTTMWSLAPESRRGGR